MTATADNWAASEDWFESADGTIVKLLVTPWATETLAGSLYRDLVQEDYRYQQVGSKASGGVCQDRAVIRPGLAGVQMAEQINSKLSKRTQELAG